MSPWESLKLGQKILTVHILTTDLAVQLINVKTQGLSESWRYP